MTNGTAQEEIILTPEQRRQLGHVYRLILGWRRERKKGAPVSVANQPTDDASHLPFRDLETVHVTESAS